MTLESYEYRDPGEVVATVFARRALRPGDVVLALVRDPSGEQQVVRMRSIPRTRRKGLDRHDLSHLLASYAERLGVPQRRGTDPPRYSIMTIVARRGYAVFGPDEGKLMVAWLYSNHLTGAFAGELIVVTEHGWADQTTGWGGYEPRIAEQWPRDQRRSGSTPAGVT